MKIGGHIAVSYKKRKGKYIKEGQEMFSKYLDKKDYKKCAISVILTVFRILNVAKKIMRAMEHAIFVYQNQVKGGNVEILKRGDDGEESLQGDDYYDSGDYQYYGQILMGAQYYAHNQYRAIEIDKLKQKYKQLQQIINNYKNRIINTHYECDNSESFLREFLQDKQIELDSATVRTIEKQINEINVKYNEIFNTHCHKFNLDEDEIKEWREKLEIF